MKSKRGLIKWLAGGLLAAGAVAAIGLGATRLHAQGFHRGWGEGPMMALGGILHDLDLTADQKKQIAGILRAHKSELLQTRQKMGTAGKAMMEAIADQDSKPEVLQARMDAVADAAKQMGKAWITVRKEAIVVLTPQQKQDLAKRQQRFLQKMEARMTERQGDQEQHIDDLIDRLTR
jgi:Spy/CpxP family protein refolding chaperone